MAYRSVTRELSSHREKWLRSPPMRCRDRFEPMCLFGTGRGSEMKKLLSVLSVFALAAIAAGSASAGSITTPTGLNPGDQFRIVFLSSTKTPAIHSNLSPYDDIVSRDATGYTYGGITPTWKAIVSGYFTDARDHIGLLSTSQIPLFTVDGTKVTTGNLWSGSILSPINRRIDGSIESTFVWTGTNGAGGGRPWVVGAQFSASTMYGHSDYTDQRWTAFDIFPGTIITRALYGISDVLSVPVTVPEPSSVMLAGLGGLAALAYSFKRKRKV